MPFETIFMKSYKGTFLTWVHFDSMNCFFMPFKIPSPLCHVCATNKTALRWCGLIWLLIFFGRLLIIIQENLVLVGELVLHPGVLVLGMWPPGRWHRAPVTLSGDHVPHVQVCAWPLRRWHGAPGTSSGGHVSPHMWHVNRPVWFLVRWSSMTKMMLESTNIEDGMEEVLDEYEDKMNEMMEDIPEHEEDWENSTSSSNTTIWMAREVRNSNSRCWCSPRSWKSGRLYWRNWQQWCLTFPLNYIERHRRNWQFRS